LPASDRMRQGRTRGDRGSAVVEFLAFGVPGVLLLILAFQVVWAGYLANAALDVASEGAGIAAAYGGTPASAKEKAQSLLKGLAGNLDFQVATTEDQFNGRTRQIMTVSVSSPYLGFGLIPVTQSAKALNEIG